MPEAHHNRPDPFGLWVPTQPTRPFAELLGLTETRERRSALPPGSAVYLTAMDYIPQVERSAGREYDPQAWLSTLLCQFTRTEHLRALATLNHVAQHVTLSERLERETVTGTHPELSAALSAALRGETGVADGQPRIFLARHLVLRAIRLVAHLSPADEHQLTDAETRTGRASRAFDPLLCAVMLTHAIGDGMGAHTRRTQAEPLLGGLPESLALELICSGAFTRQGNHGNLLARTLLLYRDIGATVTKPLRASPLTLAEDALGMPLLDALTIGFHFYALVLQSHELRTDLTASPPDYTDEFTPGAVTAFLDRFAGSVDDLAAVAAVSRRDWQNLYLQERPLLRVDDRVLVLDEAFLLERLTTGLFFLVVEHERAQGGEPAVEQWRQAYAQMHEALVESYIARFAPVALDGTPLTFDEDDLQRAYDRKGKRGGGRVDIGVDFGDCVLLADAMSGQLSVKARLDGDRQALADDLDRLVVNKVRQLAGSFEKVTRDPQPPGAPIAAPAPNVHTAVVPGGQFPGVPPLIRFLNERLEADPLVASMLADPRCRGMHVLDLRDLEHAEAVRAADHRTLPEMLAAWKADDTYAETSLSDWLLATSGQADAALARPELLVSPVQEVFSAVERLIPPNLRRPNTPGPAEN